MTMNNEKSNSFKKPLGCRWTSRYLIIVVIVLIFVLLTDHEWVVKHIFGQKSLQAQTSSLVIVKLQKEIKDTQEQLKKQVNEIVQLEKRLKVTSKPSIKSSDIKPPPGDDWCKLLPKGPVPKGSPWWKYLCLFERIIDETVLGGCKVSAMMGNWKTCLDKRFLGGPPCLVYSFGIANDFRFDDAMGRRGCKVYSFDPSMGVKDHQHSVNVSFKSLGLGVKDIDKFVPIKDNYIKKPQTWTIKTLKSIIKMLGHEKRFIDVLKFDVEAYEWDVMKNIIEDGLLPQIGQVLTEWHIFGRYPPRESLERHLEMFQSLKGNGLQLFYKLNYGRYHKGWRFNSQCDTCYVNTGTSRSKFYAKFGQKAPAGNV